MAAYVKLCKPMSAESSGDFGDRSLQTQLYKNVKLHKAATAVVQ